MRFWSVIITLFLWASPVSAQTTAEKVADWTSTGLVGVNVAADAVYSYRHHCMAGFLLKNALTIGSAEVVKRVVHEDRPDHSDLKSFYSEHSALAMVNRGWSVRIGFSVALGAGLGRDLALKHHPHDIVIGFGAGELANRLFPCSE